MAEQAPKQEPMQRPPSQAGLIFERMAKVAASVQAVEEKANPSGGGGVNYPFRHMADVVAGMKEPMAEAEVFLTPQVIDHSRTEYESRSGTPMQLSLMTIRFTFYTIDGSSVDVVTVGEASDASDKASNKAMTAALKYALLHTFLIPTSESDQDAERPEERAAGTTTSRSTSTGGGGGGQPMGGDFIHQGMAKKLLFDARERGDAIDMHGHEVMNHVLSLGKLATAEPRAKRDEVIDHLCRTVPNSRQWMDWLLAEIKNYSAPQQAAPAGPGPHPTEQPGPPAASSSGGSGDDIPF